MAKCANLVNYMRQGKPGALHYACLFGAEREVRMFLRAGADCDDQPGDDAPEAWRYGVTPLIAAAGEGHVGTVRILLAAGARVDLAIRQRIDSEVGVTPGQ